MSKSLRSVCFAALISLFSLLAEAQVQPMDMNPGENVEFAVSICESVEDLQQKLNVSLLSAKKRSVTYFDDANQTFTKSGVILRLRHGGKKSDFTLKIRPSEIENIPPEFFNNKGFKCEYDVNRVKITPSCSDKNKTTLAVATQFLVEGRLSMVMRDSQWMLAGIGSQGSLPWDDLQKYGPADTYRWKGNLLPVHIDSEIQYWQLPDGRQLMEASFRVPTYQFEETKSLFMAELKARNVQLCETDRGKTKQVLELTPTKFE